MAIFVLILKNPFVGFASTFFFGRQVAKIRHKKKPWTFGEPAPTVVP